MSRTPGPTRHDPLAASTPSRTPGCLGVNDAGDPNACAAPGDTPGPVGVNDPSAVLADSRVHSVIIRSFPPPIFAGYQSSEGYVILIGEPAGLLPSEPQITLSFGKTEETVTVKVSNWRKVKGYADAVRIGAANFAGIDPDRLKGASVVAVSNAAEIRKAVRDAGSRRIIYFGHSDLSKQGTSAVGLCPGGLAAECTPVQVISESLAASAPVPIIEACMGASLSLSIGGRKVAPQGPTTYIEVSDFEVVAPQVKKGREVKESDLQLQSITIVESNRRPRYLAPAVALPPHVPSAPP